MVITQFSQVAVGQVFNSNGVDFIKKSSRTARVRYGVPGDRKAVRYFRTNDSCVVVETRKVINLMTGKETLENANTPRCCSVASETYWCM